MLQTMNRHDAYFVYIENDKEKYKTKQNNN